MKLAKIIQTISKELQKQNAKAIVVGGSVRDHFLELPIKDYDVEVYGLDSMEQLADILRKYGSVNLVGKSFGVLKLRHEGEEYDFSFPRTETKVGEGHRGFDVEVDGNMSFEHAARRRDFTVNAIGYDVEKKQFLDPFGGLEDIKAKRLRHIDNETFIEDPLRVYRAVQFCARFEMDLAEESFILCQRMVAESMLDTLPKERVYVEWKKLLLMSEKPSIGFELMRQLGILKSYFPELHALIEVPQSLQWHPEGDVWVHTMMCVDEMANICRSGCAVTQGGNALGVPHPDNNTKQTLKLLFAILCHDLGKALSTTVDEEGKIRAIGHEEAGLAPTKSLMLRLMDEHDFIESLLPLVEHHLKPSQFYAGKSKASAIRRLATKVNIEELVVVAKADFLGRTTALSLLRVYHAGEWLLEKSKDLQVSTRPLDNLLQGRDLIELGFIPSPRFKVILDEVYALQLEGDIVSKAKAIEFVKERYM